MRCPWRRSRGAAAFEPRVEAPASCCRSSCSAGTRRHLGRGCASPGAHLTAFVLGTAGAPATPRQLYVPCARRTSFPPMPSRHRRGFGKTDPARQHPRRQVVAGRLWGRSNQITVGHVEAAARDSRVYSLPRPPGLAAAAFAAITRPPVRDFGGVRCTGGGRRCIVGPRPPVAEKHRNHTQPAPAPDHRGHVPAVPPSPTDKARSKGDVAQEPAPQIRQRPRSSRRHGAGQGRPPKPSPEQVAAAPWCRKPGAGRLPRSAAVRRAPAPPRRSCGQRPRRSLAPPRPNPPPPLAGRDKLVLTKTGSQRRPAPQRRRSRPQPRIPRPPPARTCAGTSPRRFARVGLPRRRRQTFTPQIAGCRMPRALNEVEARPAATEADMPNAKLFMQRRSIRGKRGWRPVWAVRLARRRAGGAGNPCRELRDARYHPRRRRARGETPR